MQFCFSNCSAIINSINFYSLIYPETCWFTGTDFKPLPNHGKMYLRRKNIWIAGWCWMLTTNNISINIQQYPLVICNSTQLLEIANLHQFTDEFPRGSPTNGPGPRTTAAMASHRKHRRSVASQLRQPAQGLNLGGQGVPGGDEDRNEICGTSIYHTGFGDNFNTGCWF